MPDDYVPPFVCQTIRNNARPLILRAEALISESRKERPSLEVMMEDFRYLEGYTAMLAAFIHD